ncbi:MAG: hypothetical protein DYG91_13930 [Chloroflexi bacterium CFX7]|nr:MAG: hypothetical protein EDM76_11170 [bacterium]MCE7929573.1 hypothetical protein [Chloroflexi bacterium CFX7]RIL02725.1 MAG: hypothetical protein DCC78_06730 [bacterium]
MGLEVHGQAKGKDADAMTTVTTCTFPSTRWFEAVGEVARRDEETFRKLGFIDTTLGVSVLGGGPAGGDRTFVLSFGAYTLDEVHEAAGAESVDFTLRAPLAAWEEMIRNIRENDGADLHHTLNYLHFGVIDLVAEDQLKADLFFRVNGSLQAFFDASAGVETEFPG